MLLTAFTGHTGHTGMVFIVRFASLYFAASPYANQRTNKLTCPIGVSESETCMPLHVQSLFMIYSPDYVHQYRREFVSSCELTLDQSCVISWVASGRQ
ncbi:uncharacterized protein BJX67DRAFT_357166 [Aspergillus lucknowensis]|uniref:Secreted protein n=1 Tax=Aspergillus lucknowensis TaxID=176173 RepID=A0ABR4LMX4_9EURO